MAFHRNWRYDDYYAERLIWFMENDYGWKPFHFPDHIIGDEFALQWRNVKHYIKVIRRLVRQGEYTEVQYHTLCKEIAYEKSLHKFIEANELETCESWIKCLENDRQREFEWHNQVLQYLNENKIPFEYVNNGKTFRIPVEYPDLNEDDMHVGCHGAISKAHKFIRKRSGGKLFKYYEFNV